MDPDGGYQPPAWDPGDGACGRTVWRVLHYRFLCWEWDVEVHQLW